MKNSKGETLPQPYYDLAMMRREQQAALAEIWANYFNETQGLDYAFDWGDTPEKDDWWRDVYYGETPEIPLSSLQELEAWREKKISEFVSELKISDEPDYKEMYEQLSKETSELVSAFKELGAKYDELKYGDPTRNWIAECAIALFSNMGISNCNATCRNVWEKAEEWAAEGKKRGHLPNNQK